MRQLKYLALLLTAIVCFAMNSPRAFAVEPTSVSFTLEGCRLLTTTTLPNGSGQFICSDPEYTTGNLGKNWNELDLVPGRLTARAGNSAPASQSYTIAVVVDAEDAGHPGYDVLSAPVLNTSLSDAGCSAAIVNPTEGADPDGPTFSPGIGGTDVSRYRELTITQSKNTECVYDFYARLALGSHLYPGSSLHFNVTQAQDQDFATGGIGARDVSIPVKEILPQELGKTMSARKDTDNTWTLSKIANPAVLEFGDVCTVDGAPLPKEVEITVSWTKVQANGGGGVTATAVITATNPAHRTITVSIEDELFAGATPGAAGTGLQTVDLGSFEVEANSMRVIEHDVTLDPSVGDVGDYISDRATATYVDLATGVPVPGQTTAIASAQITVGNVSNSTAVITDVESISGDGLTFSVATPASGSLVGYTAGTQTTGPVEWSSGTVSESGSVTLFKTVYLDTQRITSGTLSDTASLVASDGFEPPPVSVDVLISSTAAVELTLIKAMPDLLDPGESFDVDFEVSSNQGYLNLFTLIFGPGEISLSKTLIGLVPALYTIEEGTITHQPSGRTDLLIPLSANPQSIDLSPGDGGVVTCSATANFANGPRTDEPPHVRVEKITDPALDVNDPDYLWMFSLFNSNDLLTPIASTTAGAGAGLVDLGDIFVDGSYVVTETEKDGWRLDGAVPNDGQTTTICAFTVDVLLDAGRIFSCSFHNTKLGHADVIKTVSGQPPVSGQSFTFQLRIGASPTENGTTLETEVASDANGGTIAFSTDLVPGDHYQLCEIVMPGWTTTVGTLIPGAFMPPDGVAPNPDVDNSIICGDFTVAAGETRTFTVDNSPPPGGNARTIGFWRNWSSCKTSNGHQDPVLDETLATFPIADGQSLPGVYIGDLYVDTCDEAVNLLKKQSLDGDKKASDKAFNMAAQLMAAVLNVQAGAGVCPEAAAAIAQAQALLDAYDFDGFGHKPISKSDQKAMASLASTLDRYNNNTLCGS